MRFVLLSFLTCTLFGQSSTDISPEPQPAPEWIMTTDKPAAKIVIRLDTLPDNYQFEFWNNGDAPVLTKEQILKAVALLSEASKENVEKSCVLGARGQILNYPCRVKPTLTAARKR
jgi:hypothetical protein